MKETSRWVCRFASKPHLASHISDQVSAAAFEVQDNLLLAQDFGQSANSGLEAHRYLFSHLHNVTDAVTFERANVTLSSL